MSGKWINVDIENLPVNGIYDVKVVNNGVESVVRRRLKGGTWSGGCRPFTYGEVVTHYHDRG